MAIHLLRRLTQFPETWSEINRTTYGVGNEKLTIGYDGPARLSFSVTAANHTIPWAGYATFLKWWDDDGKLPNGDDQDEDHPAFEGWIEEVTPGGDTNEIEITAYDPTYRANRMVVCMSQPWSLNPVDEEQFPVDGTGAYPRVALNAHNDADPDWAYSVRVGMNLAQIIRFLLDYQYLPLLHCSAAPGDGSPQGNMAAYDDEELFPSWSSSSGGSSGSSSSGQALDPTLSFVPLEKLVFQAESPRAAIERVLQQWAPEFKLLWEPGTRLWRIVKLVTAPATTITWNDLDEEVIPFGIDVRRSSEGKCGAVKFYGPQGQEWREFIWTNPDIESSGDSNTLESVDPAAADDGEGHAIKCHRTFQVTDPSFTAMLPRAVTPIGVPSLLGIQRDGEGNIIGLVGGSFVETYGPQVLARFVTSAGGDDGWLPMTGWVADFRTGTIRFGDSTCMGRRNVGASGGEPIIQEPWQVKLVTPVITIPLSVRYPAAGYAGTLSSVGGIQVEQKQYDEQLAIAVANGTPITTPLRLSRFRQLARAIHNRSKDVDHVGTIMFDGLDWRWLFLNKRVHLAAKDDNGNTLNTGWENIGAFVTSVEYDVENCQTSINFSDDQAEVLGLDLNVMKNRLRIRAATFQWWWTISIFYGTRTIAGAGGPVILQDISAVATRNEGWYDDQGGLQ